MSEDTNYIICAHCLKKWDKTLLTRSCSNCFACTGCEAYVCPECRYEIVIIPPLPMKKDSENR